MFSFARSINVLGMSRGFTPDVPRRPETWVSICKLMPKLRVILLSSGRMVPRVTIGRVTPLLPHERPNVTHSGNPDTRRLQLPLDGCCRLVLPYHAVQHATDGTDP